MRVNSPGPCFGGAGAAGGEDGWGAGLNPAGKSDSGVGGAMNGAVGSSGGFGFDPGTFQRPALVNFSPFLGFGCSSSGFIKPRPRSMMSSPRAPCPTSFGREPHGYYYSISIEIYGNNTAGVSMLH